jgi:hypothetical protein
MKNYSSPVPERSRRRGRPGGGFALFSRQSIPQRPCKSDPLTLNPKTEFARVANKMMVISAVCPSQPEAIRQEPGGS